MTGKQNITIEAKYHRKYSRIRFAIGKFLLRLAAIIMKTTVTVQLKQKK